MGNQALSLPDGASGDVLKNVAGPKHIPITDRFWFELLKVQLPGVEHANFFDTLYKKPEVLDGLVYEAYFLQLVATNECSGNFRTFLRFWSRLLHYYRTSPRDAKPCGASTVLSLTVLCRSLLKHFAGTFLAPLLIFQLEQTPYESASDTEGLQKRATPEQQQEDEEADEETKELEAAIFRMLNVKQPGARLPLDEGQVFVSYCGRKVLVRLPTAAAPAAVGGAPGAGAAGAVASAEPAYYLGSLASHFSEDAAALRDVVRCAVRAPTDGEVFAAADLAERIVETGAQELVLCPGVVPSGRKSTLRGVFREIADFLVSSSFGAVSGDAPSPSTHREGAEASGGDGHAAAPPPRNLSVAPQTLQLQALLLEILLTLSASLAPRYAPPSTSPLSAASAQAPGGSAAGALESGARAVSRLDFCAPLLFSSPDRLSPPPTPAPQPLAAAPSGAAGASDGAAPGEAVDIEGEAHEPFSPHPPYRGEAPKLPLLEAFLEVLEEDQEEEGSEALGPGSGASDDVQFVTQDASGSQRPRFGAGFPGAAARAEALVGTLLNCVWLEQHASSLTKPSKEVLRLLSGVALPANGAAESDGKRSGSDDRATAQAAAGAAAHLAARAPLVLLLLLLYRPEAHPRVLNAFANLADPLLTQAKDASASSAGGKPGAGGSSSSSSSAAAVHTGAAGPPNFAQLLRVLIRRIEESTFSLLLYCLVQRNAGFHGFCCARAREDADEVTVPLLVQLNQLPGTQVGTAGGGAEGAASRAPLPAAPPAAGTALLLTLLSLTGDPGFCEGASQKRLADGNRVLGHARPVHDATLSSLLIAVLLRVAHWNFAAARSAFFNRAVAGCFVNLAVHGVEGLHWHAAGRMLEVSQLLARNALKAQASSEAEGSSRPDAEDATVVEHRTRMVREILRALVRLISSCLQVPKVARNCNLVYALQRAYPAQFTALAADPELGPTLRHIRMVVDWFQAQCPPQDDTGGDGSAVQVARLEEAAARLPETVDHLASEAAKVSGGKPLVFSETSGCTAFFLPEVWREAARLTPDHVCWSQPAGMSRSS